MDIFHNIKCKAYPHARLNTSKGIIRSRELSLATPEEIEMALQKSGVKEYKRITIRRNNEIICTDLKYRKKSGLVIQ